MKQLPKLVEARYRVKFILWKDYQVQTEFEIWINERAEWHVRLVHQMALAMASERWGVPIMHSDYNRRDVLSMVKTYEVRKII